MEGLRALGFEKSRGLGTLSLLFEGFIGLRDLGLRAYGLVFRDLGLRDLGSRVQGFWCEGFGICYSLGFGGLGLLAVGDLSFQLWTPKPKYPLP